MPPPCLYPHTPPPCLHHHTVCFHYIELRRNSVPPHSLFFSVIECHFKQCKGICILWVHHHYCFTCNHKPPPPHLCTNTTATSLVHPPRLFTHTPPPCLYTHTPPHTSTHLHQLPLYIHTDWEKLPLALQFHGGVIRAVEQSQQFQVGAACFTILQRWLDREG